MIEHGVARTRPGTKKKKAEVGHPMGIMDNVYVKRTCPRCINDFYPGDCEIVSTTSSNKILKGPPKKGMQQHLARMFPVRLDGAYALELACRKCPHCGYLLPPNIERTEGDIPLHGQARLG